ncbi:hypothetical protein ACRZU2_004324 [Klebsiella variicola]
MKKKTRYSFPATPRLLKDIGRLCQEVETLRRSQPPHDIDRQLTAHLRETVDSRHAILSKELTRLRQCDIAWLRSDVHLISCDLESFRWTLRLFRREFTVSLIRTTAVAGLLNVITTAALLWCML